MTDQHLWFEPVGLLSRCSLNEGCGPIECLPSTLIGRTTFSIVCKTGNVSA